MGRGLLLHAHNAVQDLVPIEHNLVIDLVLRIQVETVVHKILQLALVGYIDNNVWSYPLPATARVSHVHPFLSIRVKQVDSSGLSGFMVIPIRKSLSGPSGTNQPIAST